MVGLCAGLADVRALPLRPRALCSYIKHSRLDPQQGDEVRWGGGCLFWVGINVCVCVAGGLGGHTGRMQPSVGRTEGGSSCALWREL